MTTTVFIINALGIETVSNEKLEGTSVNVCVALYHCIFSSCIYLSTLSTLYYTCLLPLLSVQVQPGLGLSEIWYSCIVSIISVGQLTGAVSVGLLSKRLSTKYILLGMLCLCCTGGVFYAIGKYGWMLLIG